MSCGRTEWARCCWVEPPASAELELLADWLKSVDTPQQMDAAEMAAMASAKWVATCQWGTIATSVDAIKAAIRRNSDVETTGLLVADAGWFPERLLGICLFHRTWTNNLFVDFFATHPLTKRHPIIGGVGYGLLNELCVVARQLDARLIWAETTKGSAPVYEHMFGLPHVGDQLLVTADKQIEFCQTVQDRWHNKASSP